VYHVLLRHLTPRHPPYALLCVTHVIRRRRRSCSRACVPVRARCVLLALRLFSVCCVYVVVKLLHPAKARWLVVRDLPPWLTSTRALTRPTERHPLHLSTCSRDKNSPVSQAARMARRCVLTLFFAIRLSSPHSSVVANARSSMSLLTPLNNRTVKTDQPSEMSLRMDFHFSCLHLVGAGGGCVSASHRSSLRKEVIQPQLPLQLPCYDFVPVISPAFDVCLLAVSSTASGVTNSHDVTGGVYKARERIHRSMADLRLLATPASCRRVAACNPNYDRLSGFAPPRGLAAHCTDHCSVCVALDIKAMLT
jgi:hypothetical protein